MIIDSNVTQADEIRNQNSEFTTSQKCIKSLVKVVASLPYKVKIMMAECYTFLQAYDYVICKWGLATCLSLFFTACKILYSHCRICPCEISREFCSPQISGNEYHTNKVWFFQVSGVTYSHNVPQNIIDNPQILEAYIDHAKQHNLTTENLYTHLPLNFIS